MCLTLYGHAYGAATGSSINIGLGMRYKKVLAFGSLNVIIGVNKMTKTTRPKVYFKPLKKVWWNNIFLWICPSASAPYRNKP